MGKIAEAREENIAASRDLRRFVEDHEGRELKADEQRTLDQLSEKFDLAEARFKRLTAGAITPEDSPSDRHAKSLIQGIGLRDMNGGAIPFPGGGNIAARTAGRPSIFPSWGEAVAKAATAEGQLKDITSGGTVAVSVPLAAEPVTDAQRVVFLRQLIPAEPAGGGFSYLKQTVRTNNAAAVPTGERKPTSIYTIVKVSDEVDVIAHLSEPIPRSYLSDAQLLRQFVDDELRYGLRLALDAEMLAAIEAEASAAPAGSNALNSIRKAITALQQADLEPTGIALTPGDWELVETSAQETFAANPNLSPTNALTRRLYGVPVVVSTGLADGTALVGDFRSGAVLFMREESRIDWSENIHRADLGDGNPGTDFERNMIVFRAEMRAKLAVTRPPAFVTVDLSGS
ncbi:hypothetical protein BH24CHL6_BH24CHL6_15410 [soil metagenome]